MYVRGYLGLGSLFRLNIKSTTVSVLGMCGGGWWRLDGQEFHLGLAPSIREQPRAMGGRNQPRCLGGKYLFGFDDNDFVVILAKIRNVWIQTNP